MIRPTLYRLGPDEHVLLLAIHHIAFDASSDAVFNREVEEVYSAIRAGRGPDLPALPIQYADYAVWQRERLQGALLAELETYWRDDPRRRARAAATTDRSCRAPPFRAIVAPTATSRSTADSDDAVAELARVRRSDAVHDAARGVRHAALPLLRSPRTSPSARRSRHGATSSSKASIGFFSNTLVLRNRLGGNPTFRDLVKRVRASTAGALAHQELPFEKLVECLHVRRDPGYNPLFQVNFRAQAGPRAAAAAARRDDGRCRSGRHRVLAFRPRARTPH